MYHIVRKSPMLKPVTDDMDICKLLFVAESVGAGYIFDPTAVPIGTAM